MFTSLGGTSSPSFCNFALKEISTDNIVEFGSPAAQTLQRNFYFDDILKSEEIKEVVIKLVKNVISMFQKGDLNFSDASEEGYGQCSYIIDDFGTIHCSLLIGKSIVSPIKYVSVPRLELIAATLSIKMA